LKWLIFILLSFIGYFESQLSEYNEQIKEICENNNGVENKSINKRNRKHKRSSTKKVKYAFLLYCLIVFVSLLSPLMIMFVSI